MSEQRYMVKYNRVETKHTTAFVTDGGQDGDDWTGTRDQGIALIQDLLARDAAAGARCDYSLVKVEDAMTTTEGMETEQSPMELGPLADRLNEAFNDFIDAAVERKCVIPTQVVVTIDDKPTPLIWERVKGQWGVWTLGKDDLRIDVQSQSIKRRVAFAKSLHFLAMRMKEAAEAEIGTLTTAISDVQAAMGAL